MTITAMGIKDSHRSRWIALVVVCCAQFMSVVDATIVNVGLPSIQRSVRSRYSSAIASRFLTVLQLRAVAVTPRRGPASAAHSFERATPSGCHA